MQSGIRTGWRHAVFALSLVAILLVGALPVLAEECSRPGCWYDRLEDGKFIVSLASNPSTGYKWMVDYDQTHLTLVEENYQAGGTDLIGASGKTSFTFAASNPGVSRMRFTYARSWELRQNADNRDFAVQSEVREGQVVLRIAEVGSG